MNLPACRIATRRSPLAVRQAEIIASNLVEAHSLTPELVPLQTRGDQMLEHPLANIGGKGLFLRELEQSLLRGETDLAVHSMKDVPAELPTGLELVAICARADARDAVIAAQHQPLHTLPPGSRIGTSSLRRQAQLRAQFPQLEFIDLRGNVATRIRRMQEGHCDAIVLACAGLERLGLSHLITEILEVEQCMPAIGQGALGIEAACNHPQARHWTGALNDAATAACVNAERAVSRALSGSCQVPLAAYATGEQPEHIHLRACLANAPGTRILYAEAQGEPEQAGAQAARQLRDQGGDAILAELGIHLDE